MLQIVYISSVNPVLAPVDPAQILVASRRNNGNADVTGMLYSDGTRFLQVLEGPEEAVETTFRRISTDMRHRAIVTLSRKQIEARQFGSWQMAHRTPGEDAQAFIGRVSDLVGAASPDVRATFESFAELRNAA